jgi:hypothetical protein
MFAWTSTIPRRSTGRWARLSVAAGAAVMMALSLGSASGPAGAHHTHGAPGPVHAGNTFGWYGHGGLVYDETFVGPLAKRWKVEGPGQVRNQHGMLTLNTATKGTVSATLMRPGRAYGRWEIRMRQRQYGRGFAPYRVLTELVPVTEKGEGCGEQNIALNKFTMGNDVVNFYIRRRPDDLYRAEMKRGFGQDQWHTFAVEITRKRISWFVDGHVIRTETRPGALTGRRFQVRFTMQAEKGKRMNRARMQMDWLRYWPLDNPNDKSIEAPRPTRGTYRDAC